MLSGDCSGGLPSHPYEGVSIPDHGELWGLPPPRFRLAMASPRSGMACDLGTRLTRKLFLDGPSVCSQITLINLAPFEFRFVWAMHALMAMTRMSSWTCQTLSTSSVTIRGERSTAKGFELDDTGLLSNVSRPALLPDQQSWKVFAASPIGKAVRCAIRRGPVDPSRRITTPTICWPLTGESGSIPGMDHHRHFAIEATSGRSDQLDRAIADHSAGSVRASGRITWRVSMTLGAG